MNRESGRPKAADLSAGAFCRWICRNSLADRRKAAWAPTSRSTTFATDASGNLVGEGDFVAQCKQTFANIETALRSANAGWGNVVEFTTYLVHSQDIPKFMDFRRREFPPMFKNGAYPPNTLLMIDRLVKEGFLIEVQAVAAL